MTPEINIVHNFTKISEEAFQNSRYCEILIVSNKNIGRDIDKLILTCFLSNHCSFSRVSIVWN